MKIQRRFSALLLVLIMALGLAGCSFDLGTQNTDTTQYYLYYLNESEDKIVSVPYTFTAVDAEGQAMELVGMQSQDPTEEGLKHLLPDGVTIDECTLEGTELHINLSNPLDEEVSTGKMLIVGGLVRTFVQIDGVDSLRITEAGDPLCDSDGNELTSLTLDDFIENGGKNINNYLYTTMTLYFADSTGTHLKAEKRKVYYSSNEPMEKAVVEALIQGPTTEGLYPVLPSDATVLSTHIATDDSTSDTSSDSSESDSAASSSSGTSQQKICYVSFDKNVQNTVNNVSEEVSLYAVVDSLVDTCGVDKVQFSINGENDTVFRSSISLLTQFSKKVL